MSMNPTEDFLHHLKKYMEYTTEMRVSYEHLTAREKEIIMECAPTSADPEQLSKNAYEWHDQLFNRLHDS